MTPISGNSYFFNSSMVNNLLIGICDVVSISHVPVLSTTAMRMCPHPSTDRISISGASILINSYSIAVPQLQLHDPLLNTRSYKKLSLLFSYCSSFLVIFLPVGCFMQTKLFLRMVRQTINTLRLSGTSLEIEPFPMNSSSSCRTCSDNVSHSFFCVCLSLLSFFFFFLLHSAKTFLAISNCPYQTV